MKLIIQCPLKKQPITTVLTIRTICHAGNLWKLARSCKQLQLLCLEKPCNIPGTALLSGFQSSQGALKSTKTVLSKYSFIWNERPLNFWNDHKAQKKPVRCSCKYFPNIELQCCSQHSNGEGRQIKDSQRRSPTLHAKKYVHRFVLCCVLSGF